MKISSKSAHIIKAVLLASLFCTSCAKNGFETSKEELIAVLNDSVSQREFIAKWFLSLCHEDSFVKHYCSESNNMTFVTSRNEYFIALDEKPMTNFWELINELKETMQYESLLENEDFERFLFDAKASYAQRFFDHNIEFYVVKVGEEHTESITILVGYN